MAVMTGTRFDVVPLSKHIGAEIRGLDLREKPDDDTIRAVYRAWLDHLVIVFPGQNLSQEDLIRVTGFFGELGELSRPAKYFPKGYSRLLPGIMLISNIRENGEPIGALPDGEMMFHQRNSPYFRPKIRCSGPLGNVPGNALESPRRVFREARYPGMDRHEINALRPRQRAARWYCQNFRAQTEGSGRWQTT